MCKKTLIFIALTLFVLGPTLTALAGEGPDGNKRKGKYTYRKIYKACMERGEVASTTPSVSPADRKQAEWRQIFETKDFSSFGCAPEWAAASDEDLMDIYAYFYHNAADSPTPATCK